jgi:hypothetical protein
VSIPGFYDKREAAYFRERGIALREQYGRTANGLCSACENTGNGFACPNPWCSNGSDGEWHEVPVFSVVDGDRVYRVLYERVEVGLRVQRTTLIDVGAEGVVIKGWYWRRNIDHLELADQVAVLEMERRKMARVWTMAEVRQ